MSQRIKQISFILSTLVLSVIAGYLALAWTEPQGAPPLSNAYPPIHSGIEAQYKEGALVVGTNPALSVGLIVQYGAVVIGTGDPGDKRFRVEGDAEITGSFNIGGTTNICYLLTYTSGSGTTQCLSGYYTSTAAMLPDGQMLCCRVSNPI
jgi:hypothetical protein